MGQFVQFAINGLMAGAIYALIAVGIVSVYKATKVVNFAHGYLIMFGAYFYFTFAVIVPGQPWAPGWLRATGRFQRYQPHCLAWRALTSRSVT